MSSVNQEMPKSNKERIEELINWLRQHDIICSAAKLHRRFCDGVALATLLKNFHPKIIDLHNYSPQSSLRLKLGNWETLNAKVLSKIGMTQSKSTLENLAKGEKHAIEALLFNIMKNEGEKRKKNSLLSSCDNKDHLLLANNQKLIITINKKIGDGLVQVPQEMILYSVYENVVHEIEKKTEILGNMKEKIEYLESDIDRLRCRIKDLMEQEEKMLALKMARFNMGVMGILQNSYAQPNRFSRISNLKPFHSSHKELISPKYEEVYPETSVSCTLNKNFVIKNSIPSDKSENMIGSPIATNKKYAKTTKIPTWNGQVLKSMREKSVCQQGFDLPASVQAQADENSISAMEKPSTECDNLSLTSNATRKVAEWVSANNSQNMKAKTVVQKIKSMNIPLTSTTDNFNRFIANIKSSGTKKVKKVSTKPSVVKLENGKFKAHGKYDMSNLFMGSKETVSNVLLPLTRSKPSISKFETSSFADSKEFENVSNLNVDDCTKTYKSL